MAKLELRLPIPAKVESPKSSPVVEDNSPYAPRVEDNPEEAPSVNWVGILATPAPTLPPVEPTFWNKLSEAVIEALGKPFCDGPCVCTGDSGTRCGKCPLRGSVNPVIPRPSPRLFVDPYLVHSL